MRLQKEKVVFQKVVLEGDALESCALESCVQKVPYLMIVDIPFLKFLSLLVYATYYI